MLGIVTWYSAMIARTQKSIAARWMTVGNLIPALVIAIQLSVFLMNRNLPSTVYPAQLAAIIGMSTLFFAVIGNFAFLGILSHTKAIEEAKEVRRVERERLLREFSARLSRLDRMRSLGALAGALAHELAQPLTAILSNAELATLSLKRSGTSTEQQVELMQSILRNARRGNAIVQRIRQRLQPVDSVLGRVDLNWITADVIDLMAPVLGAHQIELVPRMQDTPLVVSGDPTELSQVVVILLTNAIEASAASAVRRIEITLQAKGERAILSVRDQGHGLSEEALMSASEALFSTKPGGLGLGLEIATTIVRQHHGALMLANAPGGGAMAVVDLPQACPAKPSGA
jgi:signal transduction histidine kinase